MHLSPENQNGVIGLVVLLAGIGMLIYLWRMRREEQYGPLQREGCLARHGNKAPAGVLDQELFRWDDRDPYTVRWLMENLLIVGRTGSGKTSSSGKMIARA